MKPDESDELTVPEKNQLLKDRALALAKKPELRSAAKVIKELVEELGQMEDDYDSLRDARSDEQLRADELNVALDKANERIAVLEQALKKIQTTQA